MSSVHEHAAGSGRYRWVQYAGKDPVSGAQRYEHVVLTATTAKGRETEKKKLDRQWVAKKRTVGTTAVTVGEQLDEWFRKKSGGWAYGTQVKNRAAIKLATPLHDVPLAKLTTEDCDALYTKLEDDEKSSATIRTVHYALSGSLKQAIRHGRIDRNVALDAEPPVVHSKPTRPPTRDELVQTSTRRAVLCGPGDSRD